MPICTKAKIPTLSHYSIVDVTDILVIFIYMIKISLKSYLAKNEAAAEECDPDPVELVLPGLMGEAGLLGIRGLRGGDPIDPKCGA